MKSLLIIFSLIFTSSVYANTSLDGAFKQEGPELESIFFNTDSDVISEDQQELLQNNARLIVENNLKVIVIGNADSRGDRSYNIDLGARRSFAVSQSLVDLGVQENQIMYVSYGEENIALLEGKESLSDSRRVDIISVSPNVVKTPYKNRVTLHLGGAPQGLEDVEVNARRAKFQQNYEPIVGVGYQRLITNRISVGATFYSNISGAINVGLDF